MACQVDNPYISLARVTHTDEVVSENRCFSTASVLSEAQVLSEH
jgi:hypothetical protein